MPDKKQTIYDQFSMDKKAEEEGVILNFDEAGWVRILRAGGMNVRYQKRLSAFARKHKRKIDLDLLSETEARKEMIQIFAETIVIDGELRDKSGKMVKLRNNPPAVAKFFTDMFDLFIYVREQAENMAIFRVMEQEEEAKNSESS